jgi:ethanolamine utilization microcompartment shell protein EutS
MESVSKVDLRSYVFLDSLQPQMNALIGTISRGFLPKEGEAALIVEIAPGIAINQLTDVAVKSTDVRPGMQIVERRYGMLEVHSDSQADVREAGRAILEHLDLEEGDRLKPKVLSSQVIRNVDDLQVQLINRGRMGMMLVGGDSLFIMEVEPAAYAAFAANEAEKSADVNIIDVRMTGAFGRVYLGGEQRDIDVASVAAAEAIASLSGRTKSGS